MSQSKSTKVFRLNWYSLAIECFICKSKTLSVICRHTTYSTLCYVRWRTSRKGIFIWFRKLTIRLGIEREKYEKKKLCQKFILASTNEENWSIYSLVQFMSFYRLPLKYEIQSRNFSKFILRFLLLYLNF